MQDSIFTVCKVIRCGTTHRLLSCSYIFDNIHRHALYQARSLFLIAKLHMNTTLDLHVNWQAESQAKHPDNTVFDSLQFWSNCSRESLKQRLILGRFVLLCLDQRYSKLLNAINPITPSTQDRIHHAIRFLLSSDHTKLFLLSQASDRLSIF